MTKQNVTHLTGPALDWAVAKAVCPPSFADNCNEHELPYWSEGFLISGSPTINWSQTGPLLEAYCVSVKPVADCTWEAESHTHSSISTATDGQCANAYLTAACRAIVAAELGEWVEVPDELVYGDTCAHEWKESFSLGWYTSANELIGSYQGFECKKCGNTKTEKVGL